MLIKSLMKENKMKKTCTRSWIKTSLFSMLEMLGLSDHTMWASYNQAFYRILL